MGTSIIIDTEKNGIKLIHTPTMRYPEKIRDPLVIYQCMRTCLMKAKEHGIKSIVIPAFGGSVGEVAPRTVAAMMWRAWDQINHSPKEMNWDYADMASLFQFRD